MEVSFGKKFKTEFKNYDIVKEFVELYKQVYPEYEFRIDSV